MGNELSYHAIYQPTPRFGTLNFKILLSDNSNKWKRLQFNFIATSNPHISANHIVFNSFVNETTQKYNLVSNIKLNDHMKTKPILQTFITGISLKSKMTAK